MLVCLFMLLGRLTVSSHSDEPIRHPRWQYNTQLVDAAMLQLRLNELGDDGWEVFSIERADSQLMQQNASEPRITTTQYQVTSKRPAK